MVPSCVSEPTGFESPLRTSSTPAMNVVLTAPIPGNKTPSFPFAASIFPGLSITLLQRRAVHAGLSMQPILEFLTVCLPLYKQPPQIGPIPPKQTSNDARSTLDLQTLGGTSSSSTPVDKTDFAENPLGRFSRIFNVNVSRRL